MKGLNHCLKPEKGKGKPGSGSLVRSCWGQCPTHPLTRSLAHSPTHSLMIFFSPQFKLRFYKHPGISESLCHGRFPNMFLFHWFPRGFPETADQTNPSNPHGRNSSACPSQGSACRFWRSPCVAKWPPACSRQVKLDGGRLPRAKGAKGNQEEGVKP